MENFEDKPTEVLKEGDSKKIYKGIDLGEDVLKRFEVIEFLGSGGFGRVFKVYDKVLRKEVAIKVISKKDLPEDTINRIITEVATARELSDNKNVLKYYELHDFKDFYVIVMEYIDKPTIQKLLEKNKKFSKEEVEKILPSLLEGLTHLHENKIIHRDIKPSNIFLISDKEVKIGDFGIIKIETGKDKLTKTNQIIGTPTYMSPEQLQGSEEISKSSDFYSLGVTLYEMLTGEVPYSGTYFEICDAIYKNLQPKKLKDIKDKRFRKLIENLLEKDPKKRWGKEEIEKYIKGEKLPYSYKQKKMPFKI